MKILAVSSQKGGVGKTTVSINLSHSLAKRGWRVILVDSDPQGGIGFALGKHRESSAGLHGVTTGKTTLKKAIVKTKIPGLSILLSGKIPVESTSRFWNQLYRRRIFAQIGKILEGHFDLMIIDTSPGFNKGTLAALRDSRFLLSPLQGEPGAARSLPQLLETVAWVKSAGHPLQIAGLLLTMVHIQHPESLELARSIAAELPSDLILKTVIPRDPLFLAANARGIPVALMANTVSPLLTVFDQTAIELEPRIGLLKDLSDETASIFA